MDSQSRIAPVTSPVSAGHRAAFEDWLACAVGGAGERAALAARDAADGLEGRVAWLAVAGHVLDYDDTYLPGLAHLSAPVAPAALAVAAERGASVGEMLDAYAAGFEAMGALARAAHPALYEAGWHPTAVCGSVGAAVAAARLLGADSESQQSALAFSLMRAAGMRAGFGSDGKAVGVGMAAAAGVAAARLAVAGARMDVHAAVTDAPGGWPRTFGAAIPVLPEEGSTAAIDDNWIKAWPCCLQTHGAIEAALEVRERDGGAPGGQLEVVVHPVSRLAAPVDEPADGLQAKFSIPYLTAFALLHGAPRVASFASVEGDARELGSQVRVTTDAALEESEARLLVDAEPAATVLAAVGSPDRPLSAAAAAAKREELAGDRLEGALDDLARPAAELLEVVAG
jgi:2-methylcitrate dehydratase PrpD